MPSTSEQTFGNRLEHGRTLAVKLGGLADYAPDNPALTADSLSATCDGAEAGNSTVAGMGELLGAARAARRLGFYGNESTDGLGTLAGRVRDYVGSLAGGKKTATYGRVQKLTQKISNYHPPKKPVSTSPGGTAAEKKKVSQSEKSYGSIVQAGKDLAAAVGQIASYNPSQLDLQPAALGLKMKALDDLNKEVATALVNSSKSIDDRKALYDNPETGLQTLFQQAKAAVASQYGRRSAQYKTVAPLRY